MKILPLLLVLFVALNTFAQQNVTNDKKLISGKSELFYDSGKLRLSGFKKDGKRVGLWREINEDRSLHSTHIYERDGKLKSIIFYNENENIAAKKTKIKNNNYKIYYYPSGKVKSTVQCNEQYLFDGIYKEFYESGVLKIKANYKQGDLDGLWSKFNVEQGLEWEVYYQKNSKQGFYKHYSNTGILLLEGTTINNQKTGAERQYYKSGELKWKGLFANGIKVGDWEMFDKNSKRKKTITYKKGTLKKSSDLIPEVYLIPKGVYYKYPVFNNNSALSNNESRMLFIRSVVEFCKNNIDLNLAKELDLKGKITVRVRASYNKSGEIENINTFSPHKVLNDAVREALVKLPSVDPYTIYSKPYRFNFSFPIPFNKSSDHNSKFTGTPPAYPGCKSAKTIKQSKECTSDKITAFVAKNYDTNIAKQIGLKGLMRINVIYKINAQGLVVDVKARAPHPALAEEAERVIKRLPKFEPGMLNGEAVTVPYSLPIKFQIH